MASSCRIELWRSGGNASATRETAPATSGACTVAITRCPVSAAVTAMRIDSRSRISPITITSGACRSAPRNATGKLGASTPISTCSTTLRPCACSYLDRIFDGDDVPILVRVQFGHNRRHGGGLARPGRAAHKQQTARKPPEQADVVAEVEAPQRWHLRWKRANRRRGAAALEM
jgi:hypothetical protein